MSAERVTQAFANMAAHKGQPARDEDVATAARRGWESVEARRREEGK